MERSVEVQGWGGHVRTRIMLPDDGGMPAHLKHKHHAHGTALHPLGISDPSSADFLTGLIVDLSKDTQANSPLGARSTG